MGLAWTFTWRHLLRGIRHGARPGARKSGQVGGLRAPRRTKESRSRAAPHRVGINCHFGTVVPTRCKYWQTVVSMRAVQVLQCSAQYLVHMEKPPPRERERPSGARTGNVRGVRDDQRSGSAGESYASASVVRTAGWIELRSVRDTIMERR